MRNVVALVISFLACFAAAAVGALATRQAPEFYLSLSRPDWGPPASLFGPVWTMLYTLMAIAAWLVWKQRGVRHHSLALFAIQLALNALWSWLFFAWRLGTLAEVEIVVLLVMIALTVAAFWRVKPLAGVLMLPYLLWVSYATALTFSLVERNAGVL